MKDKKIVQTVITILGYEETGGELTMKFNCDDCGKIFDGLKDGWYPSPNRSEQGKRFCAKCIKKR